MSCSVGHRCSLDPPLLWLWYRPAAIAPIELLAWKPPYAARAALKKPKKKKKKIVKLYCHICYKYFSSGFFFLSLSVILFHTVQKICGIYLFL